MKKLFKIILGATVGSTLLLSSCNFLDVDPYFEATFKEGLHLSQQEKC